MGKRGRQNDSKRKRSDHERLQLFLKQVSDLNQMESAQRMGAIKLHYGWSRSEGASTELTQPEEDDLRSFLLGVRKFTSENSDMFVPAIHNIIYQRLCRGDDQHTVEDFRQALGDANKQWRAVYENGAGMGHVTLNGITTTPARAFDIWLNGKYFHDDPAYADLIEQMERSGPMVYNMFRWQFLTAVNQTLNYINWLACNLDYWLRNDLLRLEEPA